MTDRAGRWVRVSGDSQSEADQLPDIDSYCDDRKYIKGKPYEVHGKSAYKGAQDPDWQRVVKDVQDRVIDVVVCWMVDRLDRQNILHAIPMALEVLNAGGRIEFSEQPECNLDAKSPTIDEDVKAFSDRIHAANQESKIKSKRVLKALRKRRDAGSVTGRAAWGYEIICDVCKKAPSKPGCRDHKKLFVPTADGRKYIPLIFARVTNGDSLRDIAAWLTAEGVPTRFGNTWNEGFIGNRLIKNPVYYGQRRNAGLLETEGLVTYDQWLEANAALASRGKPGRSTVVREKALLSPVCGNPACDATGKHPSPMYRIFTGKDRVPYYRCSGHGPQRKGCGNMFPLAELDEIVVGIVAEDGQEHIEREFIPGDDHSREEGKLRQQAMDAYARGDKALFFKLDAQADAVAASGTAPRWVERKTGITRAQHFATLDTSGRREYISRYYVVSAFKDADGLPVIGIDPPEYVTA